MESRDLMFWMVADGNSHRQPFGGNTWSLPPTGKPVSGFRAIVGVNTAKWLMFPRKKESQQNRRAISLTSGQCLPGKNSCPSSTLGESVLPWCGDGCVREEIYKIDSRRRKENYRASQRMVWA